MIYGFLLRPSIWEPLLPEPKVANALRAFTALDGHFSHAIHSGRSYAIIDSEYRYKRPESAASRGGLYWDELDSGDPNFEREGSDKMLECMDFPLVCVALSIDGFDRRPDQATRDLYEFMPLVKELGTYLSSIAHTYESACEPDDWGKLLIRSGCVTRPEYEGRGLMTALNHFVILEAKARNYQAINVGVSSGSVYRNWMRAPPGCRSTVVANVDIWNIELRNQDGRLVRPYVDSRTGRQGWLIYCNLSSE
jgi:hypothetical protein